MFHSTSSSGITKLLLGVVLAMLLGSCDKELTEIDEAKINKSLSSQDLQLIDANNALSIRLLRASFENNDSTNFFFSPVSTGMALGMLYNGVGETEKELINQFAGYESLDLKEINKSYNQLLNYLALADGKFQLTCANSLWFSPDISINEDYRTTIMAYYDAEVSEINFSRKTAGQYINNWGQVKTNGLVPGLLKTAPSLNSRIILVNGAGFTTSWAKSNFIETLGDFNTWNGEKSEIPAIQLSNTYAGISDNGDMQFLEFGLKDENIRFTAIELADANLLSSLLKTLSFAQLDNMTRNARYSLIDLKIPRIPSDETISLKPVLTASGLKSIFSQGADLSPSFGGVNNSLSDIEQTAFMHFNQADVNTAIDGQPDLIGLSLRSVEKPFLYFITEKNTGTILFSGYYIAPAK